MNLKGLEKLLFSDRPDVMSVFKVRIEGNLKLKYLLSNGNLIEEGKLDNNRHFAVWHDPFPKPSYLFALVAGDLEMVEDNFITKSGKNVILKIYVEKGNSHLVKYAMKSLQKAMKWDEDVYNLEYDLDLFQIVAVSHFNMGAMENKGLNIFNSKFVLADEKTATDDDLRKIESIIAHEYFHNWTGNRVTCRDWFQLTLKEGLTVFRDQCFSADLHDSVEKRIQDVKTLRSVQFPEDNGPNSHPIRPESYIEINNFYTPTIYEKGAEVIRMIYEYIGKFNFLKGIKLYFKRHDGKAVTCEEFLCAIEDANKISLKKFRRWYEQSGTPKLKIQRIFKNGNLEIKFSQKQSRLKSDKENFSPLPIPIKFGLINNRGKNVEFKFKKTEFKTEHVYNFSKENSILKINFKNSENKNKNFIPSMMRGFSSPVIIEDDLDLDELFVILSSDNDLFNRYEATQKIYFFVIKNILSRNL